MAKKNKHERSMTALARALTTAEEGAVIMIPSILPDLSEDRSTMTVMENVADGNTRRVTVQLHWKDVLIGQRALRVQGDAVEWANTTEKQA